MNVSQPIRLFLAAGCILCAAAKAQGGVEFETTHVQLGKVRTASDLVQRFRFTVTGDSPVEFVELRPSCGCVAPQIEKRRYQPGESGSVEFGVHTSSQTPGPHRYQVSMTVRDPRERKIVLTIDLDLEREVSVAPSNLRLILNGDRDLQQTIKVLDPRDKRLTVTEAVTSTDRLKARILKGGSNRLGEQVVALTIDVGFPEGTHTERLILRTDDPIYDELAIPVTVIRPSRVQAIPDSVRLTGVQGEVRRVVVLRDRTAAPIELDRVESPPGVDCTAQPGSGYLRLQLTVQPDELPDQAAISVFVRKPIETRIDIPVEIRKEG